MRPITTVLRRLAEAVVAALFAAMFLTFIVQVFTRYVLNDPIIWTQELTLVLYVWTVFLTGAFLLHERDHIRFEMVTQAVRLPVRRRLAMATTGIVLVAFVAALPGVADYVAFMRIERSATLRIRIDVLYACIVIFLAAAALAAAWRLWRLAGRDWAEELEPRRSEADGDVQP